MRSPSPHGGRHELGQNFLIHRPTIARIASLVRDADGPILEIGAGDGALTAALAALRRDLTAIDLDEGRVRRLRQRLPRVRVVHADALRFPMDTAIITGNIPFHLTTPILRRLLAQRGWQYAVLLTQWEVARKRAGVGGGTMMTAQAAPWFAFTLHGRVPAGGFRPRPGVDGGILSISRRAHPLVPLAQRRDYEGFVRRVFSGAGRSIDRIVAAAAGLPLRAARHALAGCGIARDRLPRDLTPEEWARLWRAVAPPRR